MGSSRNAEAEAGWVGAGVITAGVGSGAWSSGVGVRKQGGEWEDGTDCNGGSGGGWRGGMVSGLREGIGRADLGACRLWWWACGWGNCGRRGRRIALAVDGVLGVVGAGVRGGMGGLFLSSLGSLYSRDEHVVL